MSTTIIVDTRFEISRSGTFLPDVRFGLARESLEVRHPNRKSSRCREAAREKQKMAEHFANQKRGDRLLESLIAAGVLPLTSTYLVHREQRYVGSQVTVVF
jgi:hypothetical protein